METCKLGEIVFYKGNPQLPAIVLAVLTPVNRIAVYWMNRDDITYEIVPQVFSSYKEVQSSLDDKITELCEM